MKTTLKLLGLALLSSMLFFTACNNEEEGGEKVNAPTNLQRAIDGTDVTFSWSGTADSYELKVNEESYTTQESTYTLSELEEGEYTWKVCAIKGSEKSDWVDGQSFTIGGDVTEPTLNTPTGLSTHLVTGFSVVLKFKPTDDAEKYEVNVGGTKTEIYRDSALVNGHVYCYSPVELTPNTDYTWKVRGISGDERSEWTTESSFKTLANPGNTWVKVSFQQGNYKEFWAFHSQTTGGIESTSYLSVEEGVAILNVVSLPTVPSNAEDIRPHRGAFLTFPSVVGTYPLTETSKFLFVDYSDRSYITHQRRGDWVSVQGEGAEGSINVSRVEWDEQKKVYWVSGAFEATMYDSRKLTASPAEIETATLNVQVNSMFLSATAAE